MRARGESGDRFDAVIDPLGLAPLHARDPRSLSLAEERAVELALALSTPAPMLLVLHEPLADIAVARPALVSARLRDIAATGACVIVTTSSPTDARTLAERVLVLHRGQLVRQSLGGEGLGMPLPVELRVWVRTGARDLAAALARHPEVRGVSWDDATGESAWPGAAAVRVRGASPEACALAIADAVQETGVEIEGIERRTPGLDEVRATTEALWRMAHLRPAPMPAPAPSSHTSSSAAPSAATHEQGQGHGQGQEHEQVHEQGHEHEHEHEQGQGHEPILPPSPPGPAPVLAPSTPAAPTPADPDGHGEAPPPATPPESPAATEEPPR
jgi:ABC-2 type transport system ATP-binding protein